MKRALFFLLLSTSAFALECPELAGVYHCTFEDGTYSPLKIEQTLETTTDELVSYKFTYTRFDIGTDEFSANLTGVRDELGWINKCSKSKLLSLSSDGSMLGEISLSRDRAYVRKLNGTVVQTCPGAN